MLSMFPSLVVFFSSPLLALLVALEQKTSRREYLYDVNPNQLGPPLRPNKDLLSQNPTEMTIVIPRNTPIPAKMSCNIYTAEDNQTSMLFMVYQGERTRSKDNNLLGDFTLHGIPSAPKGVPIIVCFRIDVNGILTASAKHKKTGNYKKITISNDERSLSKDQIERMLQDAEMYKLEDQQFKRKVQARNALEDYAYDVRKSINNKKIGSKLSTADKKRIEDAIEKMNEWLDNNELADADELLHEKEDLEIIWNEIISKFPPE